jgi:AcrR family transcriptional regulator
MADTVLTRRQILNTTEHVLRRYGPAKATVADVARALHVSPGSIYRHFPTKVALREAVTHEWLDRMHAGLDKTAERDGPAPQRLREWLSQLFDAKKKYARDDPELFDTFMSLVAEHGEVGAEHVEDLTGQMALIIRDGIERGEFAETDVDAVAEAVFVATVMFHNPLHAAEWNNPRAEQTLRAVTDLVIAGLIKH